MNRLTDLLNAHNVLCEAGNLPKSVRPYHLQSHLEELQKLVMEEIKGTPKPATTDDDAPF